MNKPKVLLGMSGGVDSSVAAVLLVEQGYEVAGAFMKNWDDCDWRADKRDAMRVAAQLGIDFFEFDFEAEYRANVYEYMIEEYVAGRTPNPDVLCNKYMKFGFLMREAEKLGCDFVATGHYARSKTDADGTVHLLAGDDKNKDQSYFLCRLSQDQLKKVMFPIGEIEKPEVRRIATKHNLVVADKKDSQGICFVGKVDMVDFLKERIPEQEGEIITTDGEVIGKHKGHAYYTIGQRQGLGIGGGTPYFIVERDAKNNRLIVARGDEDDRLFASELTAVEITETVLGNLKKYSGQKISCRIRYRQPLQDCTYKIESNKLTVKFAEKQRAVAPGQFVALYVENELIGSAIIEKAE
ncbi:tRNA 2-thiouridine(34) synthase MnmA [Candidatus Uhrbacteria bacterium CG_4_9_14_3_um_filter_41_35]|uniref:tRNA-specific 2-thiouridylase MnmA n=1 Tax=Candidatus Uhrbacteria bacterium CG_4_9_14_3_um_filter_41_35 TaxID=1975034 RepID=A0A2M7XDZ7_9BACT|nr:MAG: tRNA 2-thiouridine(34) synthase MnmA [Candidatus Uhrbacteria bacterium CG11_big_fil_rev_8_21_14_0_20_41_9]PJA46097.1 MAG: tRNA 2-thiouridine(34) synthase MnmA [Candidatus Uhrbacteria bacterium CG_4_9_14_3_um_filter_41_35]